jgi:hypothetical protein
LTSGMDGHSFDASMTHKHLSALERDLLKSLFQPAPKADDSLDVRSFGDTSEQPIRYFVYYDVLDELTFAAGYHDQPSLAILLGNFSMDEDGAFIEVTGFTGLEYVPRRQDLFAALKGAANEAVRALTQGEVDAGRHVVGFYHGFAGSEGVLDEESARVHLSLFNMPFQVAMIVDPAGQQLGLYARPVGGKFLNPGFSVVRMKTPQGPDSGEASEPNT